MSYTLLILFLLTILLAEVTYLVIRSGAFVRPKARQTVLVDTSALMDGRIVTAAQTGFIPARLIIPRSVIHELQMLADQADPEKRSRARRGLDAVQELKAMDHLQIDTPDDGTLGLGGVDDRLIDMARSSNSAICTIDYNLNKAATAMGLRVLNINELAGSIRMAFLPGETISLALTQKGQSNTQAVGYLADGTMVVVDKAASKIGHTVEIEFIRSLQTAAGRMMFAKLLSDGPSVASQAERKAKGRTLVERRKNSTRHSEHASLPTTGRGAEATPQKKVSKGSSRSSRKTNEDSLIELLNQQ